MGLEGQGGRAGPDVAVKRLETGIRGRLARRCRTLLAVVTILCPPAVGGGATNSGAASPAPAREDRIVLLPATAERILEEVSHPGASAVLVNVWATWCQPCMEEFPDLLRLRREYLSRGLRLILVSGDFDTERPGVVRFLTRYRVDFPTFLKEQDDMAFINGLDPRWSGALPASFLYDSRGRLRRFWEGKADYATLERRLLGVLQDAEASYAAK